MIKLTSVTAGYGKKEVLHEITLEARRGEILCVIGPNGCGKSTMLKTIDGIISLTSGSITAGGDEISSMKGKDRAKRIAYLPQERQIPEMTTEELVLKGRFPHLSFGSGYSKADRDAARLAIEKLGLEDYAALPLSNLSGGIRQRAYVAMALAQEADFILLDEPFTHLDVPHRYALADIMRCLASEGRGIIAVMHELADALALSDRIVLIDNGRLKFSGTADELTATEMLPGTFGVRYHSISCNGKVSYYPERI
ncbi:MAG: ABC transporter ATP-binding protein [Clostridia bacterium]|nr:ABC transporter ATP-binding protein [Clostridia bacterium]